MTKIFDRVLQLLYKGRQVENLCITSKSVSKFLKYIDS